MKTVLVTGGVRGIGKSIALSFLKKGYRVAVTYSKDEENAAKARAAGLETYLCDVADETQVQNLFAALGGVDILVNNAGNHCKKSIEDMTVEDYESVLDVHLVGAFALTKALVPQMKARGWGRIVFQASMTSYIGQPMVAGYATAKAGYLGLIHVLTAELAPFGITVNAIAPGWIDTPMFHKAVDNDPPRLAKIMGRIPAKETGDPMDIGMVTAFLCSDAARYISGSCIPVDGGALIGF